MVGGFAAGRAGAVPRWINIRSTLVRRRRRAARARASWPRSKSIETRLPLPRARLGAEKLVFRVHVTPGADGVADLRRRTPFRARERGRRRLGESPKPRGRASPVETPRAQGGRFSADTTALRARPRRAVGGESQERPAIRAPASDVDDPMSTSTAPRAGNKCRTGSRSTRTGSRRRAAPAGGAPRPPRPRPRRAAVTKCARRRAFQRSGGASGRAPRAAAVVSPSPGRALSEIPDEIPAPPPPRGTP